MEYKFRKKLETPLMIRGMLRKYFYSFCIISVFLIIIVVGNLSQIFRGSLGMGTLFGILFPVSIFFGSQIFFTKISKIKRFGKFKNNTVTITNRDFLKIIK